MRLSPSFSLKMPPRKKRVTPFQRKHALEFGLCVTQKTVTNPTAIVAVACLFCVYFAREAKAAARKGVTSNVKYFTSPFRPENYRQHYERQHPERWSEYKECSDEEKTKYFKQEIPLKQTLHAFYGTKQVALKFVIDAPIVDVVIGDALASGRYRWGHSRTNDTIF
jgi:hypothetical protein